MATLRRELLELRDQLRQLREALLPAPSLAEVRAGVDAFTQTDDITPPVTLMETIEASGSTGTITHALPSSAMASDGTKVCLEDPDISAVPVLSSEATSAAAAASPGADQTQVEDCLPLPRGPTILPAFKKISSSLSDGSYPVPSLRPPPPTRSLPFLPYPMEDIAHPVLEVTEPWLKQQGFNRLPSLCRYALFTREQWDVMVRDTLYIITGRRWDRIENCVLDPPSSPQMMYSATATELPPIPQKKRSSRRRQ